MNGASHARNAHLSTFAPSATVAADATPWVPLSSGKAFKPLRFLAADRGFVELLRLEPGEAIPRHRHSGEVHAFNLQGWRELDSGERIGPGDYVYEPQGNVDSWQAVGAEPLIVLVVVMGAVEYLDAHGNVTQSYSAATLRRIYEQHCQATDIAIQDLTS